METLAVSGIIEGIQLEITEEKSKFLGKHQNSEIKHT